MAVNFDPYDWKDFFHGAMERDEATNLINLHPFLGSFLLRESGSMPGGYSLTVKVSNEGDKRVHHYFIELLEQKPPEEEPLPGSSPRCRFNDITFADLPTLIVHYQRNALLGEVRLLRPVSRAVIERVIGRYRFEGERVSDLPFERGEVLDVLEKPEAEWWLARNALKMFGMIPTTHIKIYEEGDELSLLNPSSGSNSTGSGPHNRHSNNSVGSTTATTDNWSQASTAHAVDNKLMQNGYGESSQTSQAPRVPAWVKVVAARQPSIFDTEAFILKPGQMLYLMEVLPNGFCRGMNEKRELGLFPLTYVEYTHLPLSGGPWSVDKRS